MQLIIHRVSKQIGGSCVEISTPSSRIIIDVGLPLDDVTEAQKPKPRLERGKPIPEGLAPVVDGLFAAGRKVDAIFLSHAHADHSGLLSHTHPDIPVFMTRGTSKMLLAGSIFAAQCGVPREHQRLMEPRKLVVIGDLTITPHSVDHSTFDCMTLLVAAGAKARWVKVKSRQTAKPAVPAKHKRKLSAAGRANIIAATKARRMSSERHHGARVNSGPDPEPELIT